MLIDYTHRNGHRELIEIPTPADVLEQIRTNPDLWPKPTVEQPDDETIAAMLYDSEDLEATDGCTLHEPDGICQHCHVAWPRYLTTPRPKPRPRQKERP